MHYFLFFTFTYSIVALLLPANHKLKSPVTLLFPLYVLQHKFSYMPLHIFSPTSIPKQINRETWQGVKTINVREEHSAHPCVAAWLLRTAVAVPLIELMGNWSHGKGDDEVTACSQPCVHVYVTVRRIHHMMHANACLYCRSWKRTYA